MVFHGILELFVHAGGVNNCVCLSKGHKALQLGNGNLLVHGDGNTACSNGSQVGGDPLRAGFTDHGNSLACKTHCVKACCQGDDQVGEFCVGHGEQLLASVVAERDLRAVCLKDLRQILDVLCGRVNTGCLFTY